MFLKQAEEAIDFALSEISDYDIKINGATEGMPKIGTASYVQRHRHEYVRTVSDILRTRSPTAGANVLELGAFFGVVCIALKRLGYNVTAADQPEFMELPEQVERYGKFGINIASVRLEEIILPFNDEQFDVIVFCETLEHLNFNPLPLLKEINRIGKTGSVFYVSLPNAAQIHNRMMVLRGQAVGVRIDTFFNQLDPRSSEIVNDHWREYTMPEVATMLKRVGYRIERQYYFSLSETLNSRNPRKMLGRLFYSAFPSLKENQTTIAIKEQRTPIRFRIPQTVHKTLQEL